ncbi:Aste57867_9852 [Aphanomyces stellatus]|uniref:RNA helicase n=1 Tax=Aphanomyces stellatus TaxID=120398 RepID=A0A485KNX0_9STRA|nr:hypothetical protein As57867_009813 [Aphanomyces stellatus]VFT86731.1 Aste57867_9852 [Aphanomyces stellatus]
MYRGIFEFNVIPIAMADDEIDPLDAFMVGIEAQVVQERTSFRERTFERCSYEEEAKESKMSAGKAVKADQVFEDDVEEWNRLNKNQEMEELAPVDHATVDYEPFRKQFYKATTMSTPPEVQALRRELDIRVELHPGDADVAPIQSFMQAGFSRQLLSLLMKHGLEAPTPIQSQAFPLAMSGRDIIGIAQTGSGKTLAFVLPMMVHIMDQRVLEKDEGPIAVILSPTRELAHQIYVEAKKFSMDANCAAIYGGAGNKWDQIQSIRKGSEIVVATPGRLMEHLRKRVIKNLHRVTFVVLDEADRMFEMGFESQLRSILGQIRPDRQTLLFSATFRRRIETLARDVLTRPVKIIVGTVGQANDEIKQMAGKENKWNWLMQNLPALTEEGKLLIFIGSKAGVDELTKSLDGLGDAYPCVSLHGDKSQYDRADALRKFKSGACAILVATDVAARGLDIKDVKNVVNYEVAKNIDTHVHRIGRTGRMGIDGVSPGTAYTLVTPKDHDFAGHLVNNMDLSNQPVSSELLAIASKSPHFHRKHPRQTTGPSSGGQHGGGGGNRRDELDAFDLEERESAGFFQTRPKTKKEQRQGLGFGTNHTRQPPQHRPMTMGFVAATAPAPVRPPPPPATSAIELSMGFVKSANPIRKSRWDTVPQDDPPPAKRSRWDQS